MELQEAILLFSSTLEKQGRSKHTLKNYLMDLGLFENYLADELGRNPMMMDINTLRIKQFLTYSQKVRNNRAITCQRQYYTLSSFCSFALGQRLMSRNEALDVPRIQVEREEPSMITEEEFLLLESTIRHVIIQRVIFFLFYSGLRISECLQLNLDDADLIKQVVHVRNGKGGKYRVVPLTTEMVKILEVYIKTERPKVESDRLFVTAKTGTLSNVYVNRHLKKAVIQLGWTKRITAHSLRHSYASHLVKQGVHHVYIQRLLGHESLHSTGIYTHVDDVEIERSIQALNEKEEGEHEPVT
ncbi:tyrosine-type recombinase/integrase [Salipaludibacillus sp. CF4.18]|uniref:tyrosine-type recombinase/integrase n=1 Tax=Salipaludibacillus sp. CF4.18 TaxID=3373081 RepID=UPI003EE58F8E